MADLAPDRPTSILLFFGARQMGSKAYWTRSAAPLKNEKRSEVGTVSNRCPTKFLILPRNGDVP
jgi:hypothetical protein